MESVPSEEGKFAVWRNNLSDGSSPFANIMATTDGAGCVIQDFTGKVLVIRIYNGKLQWKRSTDTIGTTWGDWVDIESADIKDGVPTCKQLATGRIECIYWKTVEATDKWYRAFSDDDCATWTKEEITEA